MFDIKCIYGCDSSTNLSDGNCLKGSIWMILSIIGAGIVMVLIGVYVYCKCKKKGN